MLLRNQGAVILTCFVGIHATRVELPRLATGAQPRNNSEPQMVLFADGAIFPDAYTVADFLVYKDRSK